MFGERKSDRIVWAAAKAVYSVLIRERSDWELAETFFNSVCRKVIQTVGVDADAQFVDTDYENPPEAAVGPVSSTYPVEDLTAVMRTVLCAHAPAAAFADVDGDAAVVAARLESIAGGRISSVEMLDATFYRRKGAYVIGRMETTAGRKPLVLALLNSKRGVEVDAVLADADDVSILFSFTRSHFFVDLEPAHSVVLFLRTLMPEKRVAELYTAIGHPKHGKTELYRSLISHLRSTRDAFIEAPGTPGLVMVTFVAGGHDLVFKVIRDRFPPQKRITRREVEHRYRMVFRHDRAGRLVEAHEFEHLRFEADRFSRPLLNTLLSSAAKTVRLNDGAVEIAHAYVERRVHPLDLYVRERDTEEARRAVHDYGRLIDDLASTGVFPGDLLLKNFGVTRHGRVVSYDYDELRLLQEVRFRDLPSDMHPDDEMASEPPFGVGHDDVFPEELRTFLGLKGELRAMFEAEHARLFTTAYWKDRQRVLDEGAILDIVPYRSVLRLS